MVFSAAVLILPVLCGPPKGARFEGSADAKVWPTGSDAAPISTNKIWPRNAGEPFSTGLVLPEDLLEDEKRKNNANFDLYSRASPASYSVGLVLPPDVEEPQNIPVSTGGADTVVDNKAARSDKAARRVRKKGKGGKRNNNGTKKGGRKNNNRNLGSLTSSWNHRGTDTLESLSSLESSESLDSSESFGPESSSDSSDSAWKVRAQGGYPAARTTAGRYGRYLRRTADYPHTPTESSESGPESAESAESADSESSESGPEFV